MSSVDHNEDTPIEGKEEKPEENAGSKQPLTSARNVEIPDKNLLKPSDIDVLAGGDTALLDKDKITDQSAKNKTKNLEVGTELSGSSDEKKSSPNIGEEDVMDVQDDDMELKWDDDEEIDEEKLLADDSMGDENKIQVVKGATEKDSNKIGEGNDETSKLVEEQLKETDLSDDKTANTKTDDVSEKDNAEKSPNITNKIDENDPEIEKHTEMEDDIKLKEDIEAGSVKIIAAIVETEKENILEVVNCELMDIDEFEKDSLDTTLDIKATANSTVIDSLDKTDDILEVTSSLEDKLIGRKDHNLKQPDMMIDIPTQELIDLPDDSGTSDSKDSIDISHNKMETEVNDSVTENPENYVELVDDKLKEMIVDEAQNLESVSKDNLLEKEISEKIIDVNEAEIQIYATVEQDVSKEENTTTQLACKNVTTDIIARDNETTQTPATTDLVKDVKEHDKKIVAEQSTFNKKIENVNEDPNMDIEITDSNKQSITESSNKLDVSQIKEQTTLETEDIEKELDIPEYSEVKQNVDITDTTEPIKESRGKISVRNIEELKGTTTNIKDLGEKISDITIEVPKEIDAIASGSMSTEISNTNDVDQEITENPKHKTNDISLNNQKKIDKDTYKTGQDVSVDFKESQIKEVEGQDNDQTIDSANNTKLADKVLDTLVESGKLEVNTDVNIVHTESEKMDLSNDAFVELQAETVNAEDSDIQSKQLEPDTTNDQPDTSDEVPEMTDSLGLLAESSWKQEDEQDSSGNDDGDDDEEFDLDEADESNQMTIDNSEDSNAQTSETDAPNKLTDKQAFSDIGMMKDQTGDDGDSGDKDGTLDDDEIVCDEMELATIETAEDSLEPDKLKDSADKALDREKLNDSDTEKLTEAVILKKLLTSSENKTPKKRNLSISTASSRHVVNMVWLEGSSSDEDQKTSKDSQKLKQPDTPDTDMTTINIPSEIEVMSSGESTSEILTKEGEAVISGVPKPPPVKPARLNTSEVTIKTANSADTTKLPSKSSTDAATEPTLNPEVFSLDSDEDETAAKVATPAPEHKNKKCINTICASDSSVQYFIASPSTIAYYDVNKIDKNKRAMVCEPCLQLAYSRAESLVEGIKNFTPLLDLDMGEMCQELVEISDSDSESEMDTTEVVEDAIGKDEAKFLEEQLADMMNETWTKYNLDTRLQCVEDNLSEEMARLEKESAELDEMLKKCQKDTDEIRNEIYSTFEPERRELTPILIYDTPTNLYTCAENSVSEDRLSKRRLSEPSEVPPKKSSCVPLTHDRVEGKPKQEIKDDDDRDVSVVHLSAEVAPSSLPPPGVPRRPPLAAGQAVFVMRGAFTTWHRARAVEVCSRKEKGSDNTNYTMVKIKLETRGKQCIKTVQARCLAYNEPCEVRMTIGTRIIALFKGPEVKKESYYSGVISEVPNPVNSYRYLVFFDDGYAQYVQHCDTRLVVECSPLVWEEVHPFSREFVKQYLLAYPERPMVRLRPAQKLKCEWNGQWLTCKVTKVDASLAEIVFENDNRTEWIYRGSTRLQLLFRELQAAERTKGRFMPRNRQINAGAANMPYVEYTRSDDKTAEPLASTSAQQEEYRRQRAVAKKSMGAPQPAMPPPVQSAIDNSTSRVVYFTPKNAVRPYKMVPHTCGTKCKRTDVLALKDLRTYNPLAKPLLSGWERQVVRYKGHKEVMYRAPCGRRLRGAGELHRYLRLCGSDLPVDLFDFAPTTHCLAEFVLNKCIISKKDLSNGKENVPVPCVNYYDSSLPEFCSYNTERTPTEGVPLNIDPEFLCGCDCTDDCEDKSKCACWQMTLQGARTIGFDGDVGYEYKRLLEPLPTGIYECNSRCKCKSTCLNRVAQHPLQLKLQVFKTLNRGWGIRALNDIPKGAFICVYAGNLLTDATANLDGLNEGDEYLAELDYIEVVEQIKEGYEDDIPDADKELDKKGSNEEDTSSSSEEENIPENNKEDDDGDFHPGYLPPTYFEFNKRLRKRDKAKKKEEAEKIETEKKDKDGDDDCITISDDDEVREPSRFTAQAGMGGGQFMSKKYKSVRAHFGKDEKCYIMDAKVQGNIGRYLNHSCTPNVFVQNVFVDTHDPRFPWVGFFALCSVKAGSELTWNYNYDVGSVPGKVLYCYCGAPNCRRRLL